MRYSAEERADRILSKEICVQLINRHSYYYANDQHEEELQKLWVQHPENQRTASLAYNNGYYVGMDEIAKHYVADWEQMRYSRLKPYQEENPDIACNQENLGYGAAAMHTATTPLIYIADDGKTARYQGYQLGFQSDGKPDGSADSYFSFGRIYAEFVREDDEWRIWHLVMEHDHTVEVGTAYADVDIFRPESEDPLAEEAGEPTQKQTVYDPLFGWEYTWQDMPRPYDTYRDEDSYGPNGNLGKPYYERERR